MEQLLDSIPPDQFLFTSEFACEGHSDKLCDVISDAILDACLAKDPKSIVGIEVCTKTDVVMVLGEVSSSSNINYEEIVRDTVKEAGYTSEDLGLDWRTVNIVVAVEEQSPDLASAVHLHRSAENVCAGDQGPVFGFACDETESCMPLSFTLCRDLAKQLKTLRVEGTLQWLRPDGKTQVTLQYRKEDNAWVPVRVHTVVISAQHNGDVLANDIEQALRKEVVEAVIPSNLLDDKTILLLNTSKRFVVGGPRSDAGVSGRKTDHQYGGHCIGNAVHGKDATKVEHSASYGARCAAKSLVKAGHCRRCVVQVAYAMGQSTPVSIHVNSFGTGNVSDHELARKVLNKFDFSLPALIRDFDLRKPQYKQMSVFGAFGDGDALWETPRDI